MILIYRGILLFFILIAIGWLLLGAITPSKLRRDYNESMLFNSKLRRDYNESMLFNSKKRLIVGGEKRNFKYATVVPLVVGLLVGSLVVAKVVNKDILKTHN